MIVNFIVYLAYLEISTFTIFGIFNFILVIKLNFYLNSLKLKKKFFFQIK